MHRWKIVHAYVKMENINLCSNIKIHFWWSVTTCCKYSEFTILKCTKIIIFQNQGNTFSAFNLYMENGLVHVVFISMGRSIILIYLEQELLPLGVDLKKPLVHLQIIVETSVRYFNVSQWKGVLGSLKIIQVTFPGVVHKPARFEASQGPFPCQFVQVAA